MRRISSKTTFFYKRVFPVSWFGFLLLFVGVGSFTDASSGRMPPLPFWLVPIFMAVVGYVIMRKLVFDLVDEVWDAGDALIVRNADREDRVALSNIMNVSYSPFVNPPRVTLTLRQQSLFGKQISFS